MERSFGALLRQALDREADPETLERLRLEGHGTWRELLARAQLEKAAKGDATAFRLVREMAAEEGGEDVRAMSDEKLLRLLEDG